MHSHYLRYKNSTIHYRCSGEGPKVVICFHGFGTYAQTFDWLAGHVPGHCFIAFDLPFHGETQWKEGSLFTPRQLLDIIGICPHIRAEKFCLIGYSMGGRVALQLVQEIPSRIDKLVLIAPDGLHLNPWYWFATQTAMGNRIFRQVMHKPEFFARMLHKAATYNLVNKGVMKFVDRYLKDEPVRRQVYQVWTTFRKFKPNLPRVINSVRELDIPVYLVYGRYDSIIPIKGGRSFYRRTQGHSRFTLLEAGHQLLHVKNAPYIAKAFNTDH